MKKNLLEIVKDILSTMDSEDINTLSDTVESLQVAKIVEETFYDIIATRNIPEHSSLIKLTPLSDNRYPTHFIIEDRQAKITNIWYDTSDDNSFSYKEIKKLEPLEFLKLTDSRQGDYTLVEDKTAGTRLRIDNTRQPKYYTTFDDEHIVFDAYKATVDDTLISAKVRALGVTYPTFSISDTYVPDVDANMFPYMIREATSRCLSIFKGSPDMKVEQAARRSKVQLQNDKYKTGAPSKKRHYGRGK